MVTWFHISDLHSGGDTYGTKYLGDHLSRFLREMLLQKALRPDFILFSGDIANKGKPKEYNVFNDQFLFPLIELYGDDIVKDLVFVPGNHDVDRNIHPLIDTYQVGGKELSAFDNTAKGFEIRQDLVDRFAAFRAALPSASDNAALFGETAHFVRTFTVGKTTVGIVGLNTAWLCQSDHDKGKLNPGKYGLQSGLQAIERCALRLVLGHHPTSWLKEGEREAVEAMLAQHNAIYAHGHLHDTRIEYFSRGGSEFLNLQAGAVFESRDAKERPNTILVCRYDDTARQLAIEPYCWNPNANQWGIAADGMPERLRVTGEGVWRFPLPEAKAISKQVVVKQTSIALPNGWVEVDRHTLELWASHKQTADQLLSYFDGRPPRWQDVAGIHIPHRRVVGETVNEVLREMEAPGSSLFLLTGAGGEGKSTALRQICCALLRRNPELHILFRNDDEQLLPSAFVLNELPRKHPWLIVADEAGNLTHDIHFQQQILNNNAGPQICYIVAARDTDWKANRGHSFSWATVTSYREIVFRGINLEDARFIVTTWAQYGKAGLQKLHGYSSEQAAEMLVAASKHEEQSSEGAFLGAMLTVRYGKELRNHIDKILHRLHDISSVAGHTLLDAFAAIVAIDRLGLAILTKEILARFLGCKSTEIRRHVLNPLGDEALVAMGGGYILTRHRAIATAAFELLETNYEIDFSELYKALVTSAMLLIREGKYVANVPRWRFLSTTLFDLGDRATAIEVAEMVVALEPHDSYFVVHLASLHRASERNDLALLAFRSSKMGAAENRGFFTEWAAVERRDRNFYAAVWLTALGVNDGQSSREITNDDAKRAFSELCFCGREISQNFNQQQFLRLVVCARSLALLLPLLPEEKAMYERMMPDVIDSEVDGLPIRDKLNLIRELAMQAKENCGSNFEFLPTAIRGLSFESLLRLFASVARTGG